jgi:hypothetical protein
MLEQKLEARRKKQLTPEAAWTRKGFYAASDCFKCREKVDHILDFPNIKILCMNPCISK